MVQSAPVLLLDEPGSALDFSNTHRLFRLLGEQLAPGRAVRRGGAPRPALALRYCSPVLLLKEGRIVERLEPSTCTAPQTERRWAFSTPASESKRTRRRGICSAQLNKREIFAGPLTENVFFL